MFIVFDITGQPSRGLICIIIIITPTPFIKPEITGYGTYFTIIGSDVKLRIICNIPAINITNITDDVSAFKACIIDAITIVTGPVIPETSGTLAPIRPAIKHNIIAPHKPALAPKPVATPNANACGNAIIAAFIPPNISPAIICDFVFKYEIISKILT